MVLPRQTRLSPRLSVQEILCNLPLGTDHHAASLPASGGEDLVTALESLMVDALTREPCMVSFSGGRDSSAVLAVAVEVARRHGLTEPVPVIMFHPDDPEADEREWQALVLSHLGLRNQEVLTIGDELDALSPMATAVLVRHGLRWPANAFAHRPVIELARGGTLLTGIGGDEMLTPFPAMTRRHRLFLSAPERARREWLYRKLPLSGCAWLTPDGRRLVQRGYAQDEASERPRWESSIRSWYRSRYFSGMSAGLELISEDQDVQVINPFISESVILALITAADQFKFRSRTEAMRRLFGHLLPEALLSRTTKATFGGELWGERTRSFVANWDGGGLDPTFVDAAALRREFTTPDPDFRTILLVHQAWLHSHSSS